MLNPPTRMLIKQPLKFQTSLILSSTNPHIGYREILELAEETVENSRKNCHRLFVNIHSMTQNNKENHALTTERLDHFPEIL